MTEALQKLYRAMAYTIDRGLEFPPAGSPAEKWVQTGKGDFPAWERVARGLAEIREKTIRDCAAAMGNSGDVTIERGESWLLSFYGAELSAKEPGR